MSYAIIRNTKYKRENLKGIFRHNERKNKNYSNDNIDKERSYLNYSIKQPRYSYEKEFDKIREEFNLKGQIKTVSNIACEYIITSDRQFFETIGEEETKRYFETAYQFVTEYNNLGEQYIELSVFQAITNHEVSKINGIDFDGGKNSVNIEINDHNQVIIGIDIVIDYGLNVGKVVSEIQNEVVNAIDRYIGFRNVKVNVNVNKIKF